LSSIAPPTLWSKDLSVVVTEAWSGITGFLVSGTAFGLIQIEKMFNKHPIVEPRIDGPERPPIRGESGGDYEGDC
jgi:hypothetical protein